MTLVSILRYAIRSFQRDAFRQYAETWGPITPRFERHLVASFLPWQGTNYVDWGLTAIDTLYTYETSQGWAHQCPEAQKSFGFAQDKRFILGEEGSFVEAVNGTFGIAAVAS